MRFLPHSLPTHYWYSHQVVVGRKLNLRYIFPPPSPLFILSYAGPPRYDSELRMSCITLYVSAVLSYTDYTPHPRARSERERGGKDSRLLTSNLVFCRSSRVRDHFRPMRLMMFIMRFMVGVWRWLVHRIYKIN